MVDLHNLYRYDDGLLCNKAGHIYCNVDRDGYIRVRRNAVEYRAHRIIWEMFNGDIPEGMLVDHIDGDTLNNRIENLRLATRTQNNANSKGHGNYPKGVVKVGSKYRARITHRGKTISLGTFDTVDEAKQAYDIKAQEFHGTFAKLKE